MVGHARGVRGTLHNQVSKHYTTKEKKGLTAVFSIYTINLQRQGVRRSAKGTQTEEKGGEGVVRGGVRLGRRDVQVGKGDQRVGKGEEGRGGEDLGRITKLTRLLSLRLK